MTEVLHANVFFFITAIAVIVFTLLLCIALYHVIKILKSLRRIVRRIEEGSEVLADDMDHIRTYFREGSFFSHILGLLFGQRSQGTNTSKKSASHTRSTKKKEKKTSELEVHDV